MWKWVVDWAEAACASLGAHPPKIYQKTDAGQQNLTCGYDQQREIGSITKNKSGIIKDAGDNNDI